MRKAFSKLRFAVIIIALFLLFGCAGAGNETLRDQNSATVSQMIIKGKTTKAEVRKMFGDPAAVSFTSNGLEIWTYAYAKMHGNAVNYIPIFNLLGSSNSGKKKQLVVLFNKQDVVQRYTMSSSDVSVKTGVYR